MRLVCTDTRINETRPEEGHVDKTAEKNIAASRENFESACGHLRKTRLTNEHLPDNLKGCDTWRNNMANFNSESLILPVTKTSARARPKIAHGGLSSSVRWSPEDERNQRRLPTAHQTFLDAYQKRRNIRRRASASTLELPR